MLICASRKWSTLKAYNTCLQSFISGLPFHTSIFLIHSLSHLFKNTIGYLLYSKSLSHFHFPFCAVVYLISGLLFQTPLLSPHCSLLTQIQLYTPLMSQLRCQFFPSTNTSMSCLGACPVNSLSSHYSPLLWLPFYLLVSATRLQIKWEWEHCLVFNVVSMLNIVSSTQ